MGLIRSVTVLALLLHVSSLGVNGLGETPGAEVKAATAVSNLALSGQSTAKTGTAKEQLVSPQKAEEPSEQQKDKLEKDAQQLKGSLPTVKAAALTPDSSKEGEKPLAGEPEQKDTQATTTGSPGAAKPNGEKEKLVPCEFLGPLNGGLCKVTPADKEHTTPGGTVRRAPGQGIPDVKKEDKQPDVSKEGDKSEKGKPKASPAVPPLPTVTKPKPESATAISSTIPAVLISSVVFLYLSHVGH